VFLRNAADVRALWCSHTGCQRIPTEFTEHCRSITVSFHSSFNTLNTPSDNPITLRPINANDLPFLQQVYYSTRAEELARVPWTDEQKLAFVHMQFNAQHTHYMTHFGQAEFQVILRNDDPAGRLYIHRAKEEIRIIDITLLPQHRGGGIGTILLKSILSEGAQTNRPVRIYVEHFNPALRLYERLGFIRIGDTGVYYHMEKSPV
jgi:GNAT superfamily N-acetyltransferase